MINFKLFEKIYDQITRYPQSLDMDNWENRGVECGTTRCVAGWAIFETTGRPLFRGPNDLDPSVTELAESLMVNIHQHAGDVIATVAANLLGLDDDTAHDLFHADGGMAYDVVDLFAHDREAEAREILADEEVDDSGYPS